MSYEIVNEGMGFLNALIEGLENVEKENIYLEVNAYDVPRDFDRYPYHEDDVVENFPFIFTYMGKDFNVMANYQRKFKLTVKARSDETDFYEENVFTMKEAIPTIQNMWGTLLVTIEQSLQLQPSSRHFFDIWCGWQNVGRYYNEKKKQALENRLYETIISFIDPEEIEHALKPRYCKQRNTSDSRIRNEMSELTKVEFHQFLTGRLYIIYSNEEIFILTDEETALKKYEEENVRRIKELVADEIQHFKR